MAETLYTSVGGDPSAPFTNTRSSPRSSMVTWVKSQTTSGSRYSEGFPISYKVEPNGQFIVTIPPVSLGLVTIN